LNHDHTLYSVVIRNLRHSAKSNQIPDNDTAIIFLSSKFHDVKEAETPACLVPTNPASRRKLPSTPLCSAHRSWSGWTPSSPCERGREIKSDPSCRWLYSVQYTDNARKKRVQLPGIRRDGTGTLAPCRGACATGGASRALNLLENTAINYRPGTPYCLTVWTVMLMYVQATSGNRNRRIARKLESGQMAIRNSRGLDPANSIAVST
jgi:hypothetical protein